MFTDADRCRAIVGREWSGGSNREEDILDFFFKKFNSSADTVRVNDICAARVRERRGGNSELCALVIILAVCGSISLSGKKIQLLEGNFVTRVTKTVQKKPLAVLVRFAHSLFSVLGWWWIGKPEFRVKIIGRASWYRECRQWDERDCKLEILDNLFPVERNIGAWKKQVAYQHEIKTACVSECQTHWECQCRKKGNYRILDAKAVGEKLRTKKPRFKLVFVNNLSSDARNGLKKNQGRENLGEAQNGEESEDAKGYWFCVVRHDRLERAQSHLTQRTRSHRKRKGWNKIFGEVEENKQTPAAARKSDKTQLWECLECSDRSQSKR